MHALGHKTCVTRSMLSAGPMLDQTLANGAVSYAIRLEWRRWRTLAIGRCTGLLDTGSWTKYLWLGKKCHGSGETIQFMEMYIHPLDSKIWYMLYFTKISKCQQKQARSFDHLPRNQCQTWVSDHGSLYYCKMVNFEGWCDGSTPASFNIYTLLQLL